MDHQRHRIVRTFSNDETLVEKGRDEIVHFASSLFIKKGYDRTSMSELANTFGMSKGGLYHYIGSKEDILYLILTFNAANQANFFEKVNKQITGLSPTEVLRTAICAHLERVGEYQDMYIFINHVMPNLSREDRQMMFSDSGRLVTFFQNLLIKGVEAGEFNVDDTQFLADDIINYYHQ